jgi:hypothetical protein
MGLVIFHANRTTSLSRYIKRNIWVSIVGLKVSVGWNTVHNRRTRPDKKTANRRTLLSEKPIANRINNDGESRE